MSRRLLAITAVLCIGLSAVPAHSGSTAAAPRNGRNDYTAYLKDHLKIWPVEAGKRIMADPRPIPAALIERKETARAVAAAADPCDSTDKPVGCEAEFWVSLRKANTYQKLPFVLAAKAPHSYIWVHRESYDPTGASGKSPVYTVTEAEAKTAAKRFEKIWAIDRAYFGHEANPLEKPFRTPPRLPANWRDADGDVHINIVNYPMDVPGANLSYVAGYYSSADEYPYEISPRSNEGEFFYMNSMMLDVGGDTYSGVLAHEFYHMIQFANDSNEESWINEGMADIAIEVNAIPGLTEGHMSTFFNEPEGDQLNHWGGQIIDYGGAYAFLTYLFEHYGGPDNPKTSFKENYTIAKPITQVAEDGFEGLDVVLATNPRKSKIAPYYRARTADQVYLDWAVANFLDDTSIDAGQYGYYSRDLKVAPLESFDEYPAEVEDEAMPPYTNRYYRFDSSGDGGATVTADRLVQIVDNLEGLPSGTHEYWGNRADEMETTMTRAADLRGTSSPELKFWYWYDIETDWDYGYLEVSEDAGRTWTPVACCESTFTNPNGQNQAVAQGAGITGQSGVDPATEQAVYNAEQEGIDGRGILGVGPTWVHETVDLSDHAGKRVLIRFRYWTDASVTNPGFTVDDVELVDGSKAIWPKDTAESPKVPWALEGNGALTFERITPLIPNKLTVQLIKFGAKTIVARPRSKVSGSAIRGAGAMDALRSVVVIASLSRVTSESYGYGLVARASKATEIRPPSLKAPPAEISQPYTLRWEPASNAGKLKPREYVVEETTVLASVLEDDAEGGLGKWETSQTEGVVGWSQSQDASHSGSSSFHARGIEGIPEQEAVLTTRERLAIPVRGQAELRFWQWFLNEGDDAGFVEASVDGKTWTTLGTVARSALAPQGALEAAEGRELSEQVVALDSFQGKSILLRFRYTTGPDNRVGSTPFGWYVDDVVVRATDWREIGRTAGTSFVLSSRPAGTNTYRVGALYTANLLGPWSGPVTTKVKASGAQVRGSKTIGGGPLPATGVGGLALPGLGMVLAALALGRSVRRSRA